MAILLNTLFEGLLKKEKIRMVKEHKFLTNRKFRFDFADIKNKVAVEIEGGVYVRGRHTRAAGYIKDTEKYNLALVNGWRVLRYCTSDQIAEFPDHYFSILKNDESKVARG